MRIATVEASTERLPTGKASRRLVGVGGAMLLGLLALAPVAGAQPRAGLEPVDHALCRLIESAARAERLPVGFLTRVIWRESSFRPGVVSPAGAQGIAQFMPGTAQQRGLADPFDPEEAIPKAAGLLDDLRRRYGSLAAAAAAYNAGPGRVASWLHGQGDLPAVTYSYVRFVTAEGVAADAAGPADFDPEPAAAQSCLAVTAALRRDGRDAGADDDGIGFAPLAPWGVQLAGNFSKTVALASFERARRRYAAAIGDLPPMIIGRLLRSRGTRRFYQIRLPAQSRAEADVLCRRILSVGGACIATRS